MYAGYAQGNNWLSRLRIISEIQGVILVKTLTRIAYIITN